MVGQRRGAERDAFAGEALGLAVEGLVLAILLEQQHGEEAGPGPSARHDMERRRGLCDRLAIPARELLAHRLDHLPLARDHLESLGHVLAQLRQARATASRARTWRRNDDTLAREMFGERLAARPLARKGGDIGGPGRGDFGGQVILAGIGLKVFQL